jgi:general secretion pathway protein N
MTERLLVMLLAACAAFAGLIVIEFVSEDTDRFPVEAIPAQLEIKPKPRTQEARAEDLVATALAGPLFSPTRRPPEQSEPASAADPGLPDVRLTGIVIESDHRTAIFTLAGAKPLVRSEGETLEQWRLDSISPQEVSFSGPGGTRTLEPKSDPNLVRPPPPHGQPKPGAPPSNAAGGSRGGAPTLPAATAPTRRLPPTLPPQMPVPAAGPSTGAVGASPVVNPIGRR